MSINWINNTHILYTHGKLELPHGVCPELLCHDKGPKWAGQFSVPTCGTKESEQIRFSIAKKVICGSAIVPGRGPAIVSGWEIPPPWINSQMNLIFYFILSHDSFKKHPHYYFIRFFLIPSL